MDNKQNMRSCWTDPFIKQRKIIALILTGALLVIGSLALFALLFPREPDYQGKTVDSWLDETYSSDPEVSKAFQQMGAAAVPYIYKRLLYQEPRWNRILSRVPAFLQDYLPQTTRYDQSDSPWVEGCLHSCGSNAIPLIMKRLNDTNVIIRGVSWHALALMWDVSGRTDETISLCEPGLKDPEPLVRESAGLLLCRLGPPEASRTVPLLLPLLRSGECYERSLVSTNSTVGVVPDTILFLGNLGPAASNALPALRNLFTNESSYVRVCAAVAVWKITCDENLAIPLITEELPKLEEPDKSLVYFNFEALGVRAKALFPLLARERPTSNLDFLRSEVTNALRTIDPEAAAKLFGETNQVQR